MTVSRSQPIPATPCKHDVTQDCPACAEETIAALKARVAELETALQFIADGYDNHDVNHVDYRVKVYQVALAALGSKAGS